MFIFLYFSGAVFFSYCLWYFRFSKKCYGKAPGKFIVIKSEMKVCYLYIPICRILSERKLKNNIIDLFKISALFGLKPSSHIH
jgi:hypothetical protein